MTIEYNSEVSDLVRQVAPLLSGKPAAVVGAALADLLAMLLAGHFVEGDQKATDKTREAILQMHIRYVRKLIPVNAEMLKAARAYLAAEKQTPESG